MVVGPQDARPPRSPASKKREATIAVAVKCSPQTRPGQPEVVFCQPEERRVWVQRGSQILFSSTFEVVLPSSATASETYTRTAEAPVRHACGGGQACVICYGANGSGKVAVRLEAAGPSPSPSPGPGPSNGPSNRPSNISSPNPSPSPSLSPSSSSTCSLSPSPSPSPNPARRRQCARRPRRRRPTS